MSSSTRRSQIPGLVFDWFKKADEFKTRTNQLKREAVKIYDEISQVKTPTFNNIIGKLAKFELRFATEVNLIKLFSLVHPNQEWRDSCSECDEDLMDLQINLGMRKDVFDQFVALEKMDMDKYSASIKKYVQEKIKSGKQFGLHLPEDTRRQVELITREIEFLSIKFLMNFNEVGFVKVAKEELMGCPQMLIDSLEEVEPNVLKLNLKYPNVFPVLKTAELPNTRKLVEQAYNSRCKEKNGPLLKKIIELRFQRAKLLGYDTHADAVLDKQMAKNAENVKNFLEELHTKLEPLKQKDLDVLIEDKKNFHAEKGWEFNGKIDSWDYRFYIDRYEQSKFTLDYDKLREYFPMDVVTQGVFGIYEKLLNLKFELVNLSEYPDVSLWHEEVKLYAVMDISSGNRIGHFALDLFARKGKFGKAEVKIVQPSGLEEPQLECNPPCRQNCFVALLASFTRPSKDGRTPSLLDHDEVVTYVHEFGHIMHALLCQLDYSELLAFGIERDFIECPSLMLENWCWQPETLSLMSQHYITKEPIPHDMLKNLQASRVANAGISNSRQICLALLDLRLHTEEGLNAAAELQKITRKYAGIELTEDTNIPSSFKHLVSGYDAQYYCYLWSEVYAADLFRTRFLKEGLLNSATGHDYRVHVLQPGGFKSGNELFFDFLGRPPSLDAFLEQIGVAITP